MCIFVAGQIYLRLRRGSIVQDTPSPGLLGERVAGAGGGRGRGAGVAEGGQSPDVEEGIWKASL